MTQPTDTTEPISVEDAEYDLALAKRAWSGRSVEQIDADLEAARVAERAAIRANDGIPAAQGARFRLQKERTKALAVRVCEAALAEAKRAGGAQ